jgi:hypothetical protein
MRNMRGFGGGDYEECRLLGCYATWLLYELTFRKNILHPLSGRNEIFRSVLQLLVIANIVPSSLPPFTLMM